MLKRVFDITFSGMGIFLLSPFFLTISVLMWLSSEGDIFFLQERMGENEHLFKLIKFRTMLDIPNSPQFSPGDDSRVTKVGAILRKTKLDELPQLINVFKGDMSLVGPRPEVPKYLKYYTEEQRNVLKVRPGITDIASIKFIDESLILKRSEDPEREYIESILPEKLNLNLQYIRDMSFLTDIKLILQTIIKIFAA